MLTIESLAEIKQLKTPNTIFSLGVFDGIHIGHQKVVKNIVRYAKAHKGTSVILTFSNHPYTVLNPSYKVPILTTTPIKLKLLADLGVDICILMKFDKNIALITAEAWIKEIMWNQLHIKAIHIGRDSYFGKNRKGTPELLQLWGNKLGFNVNILEKKRINKTLVSSTMIRNFILRGDIDSAEKFLGRSYSVLGTVVKGTGRGKKLGFPTANLETNNQCLPSSGVYAAIIKLDNKNLPAAVNIGIRPTFKSKITNNTHPVLEVHVLKKVGELYKKTFETIFIKKIRNERKFVNKTDLIRQINKDIAIVNEVL